MTNVPQVATELAGPAPSNRRRAPRHDERLIDADRTKAALLDAALDEFAAKGFAGARVREIATRAGVSKDLIAYHFGGKEGLYLAVQAAWLDGWGAETRAALSLTDSVTELLSDALIDSRPMRLMAWRGLHDKEQDRSDGAGESHPLQDNPLIARQEAGEIEAALDPATLQLVLLGAIAAPVVFPDAAERLFGMAPSRREFEIRYREGLAGLIEALSPPRVKKSSPSPKGS